MVLGKYFLILTIKVFDKYLPTYCIFFHFWRLRLFVHVGNFVLGKISTIFNSEASDDTNQISCTNKRAKQRACAT